MRTSNWRSGAVIDRLESRRLFSLSLWEHLNTTSRSTNHITSEGNTMTRIIRCARSAGLLLAIQLLLPSPAHAEFRSFDGTGNNLANPLWGSAATDYAR